MFNKSVRMFSLSDSSVIAAVGMFMRRHWTWLSSCSMADDDSAAILALNSSSTLMGLKTTSTFSPFFPFPSGFFASGFFWAPLPVCGSALA